MDQLINGLAGVSNVHSTAKGWHSSKGRVIVSPTAYTHASSLPLLQSLPGPVSREGIELHHFPIHVVGKGSTRAIQSQ